MSEPFLAEIRIFAFNFAPRNWALCNGQILPISQNTALFSLLGTTYGGNGVNTFALPDLRGRAVMGFSPAHTEGEVSGEESHPLSNSEMPQHVHTIQASNVTGNTATPVNNILSAESSGVTAPYAATANATMNPAALGNAGSGQAHANMQPYQVLNFAIALAGIFPSRS